MELKEGLYIALGKKTNVLIRVTGKAPLLNIVSGVCLNEMEKDGTVRPLTAEDPEIQDIICNPSSYVFTYPCVSDAVTNEKGLDLAETKKIEYTATELDTLANTYKEFLTLHGKDAASKFNVHLMQTKQLSISQARSFTKEIVRKLKL